MTHHRSY